MPAKLTTRPLPFNGVLVMTSDGVEFCCRRTRTIPHATWDEIDAYEYVAGYGWDSMPVRSGERLRELDHLMKEEVRKMNRTIPPWPVLIQFTKDHPSPARAWAVREGEKLEHFRIIAGGHLLHADEVEVLGTAIDVARQAVKFVLSQDSRGECTLSGQSRRMLESVSND